MERRVDDDLEKLGMPDSGEFQGEQPVLGDEANRLRIPDDDGYVASDGLMASHQRPADVDEPYDQGLDRHEREDVEELRNIAGE